MLHGILSNRLSDHKSGTSSAPRGGGAKPSRKRWILENGISFCLALLLVFMIRSSIVEAFKIPSGSMIPTLLIGDHIFVNKFAYGLKVPFSDLITDHPIYITKREPPRRGDVIVFMWPKDEKIHFIKRVVGIPGDTVEIRNKILYINKKPVRRDLIQGPKSDQLFNSLDDPRYSVSNLDLYTEHLDQVDHSILQDKTNYMGESHPLTTVPEGSLFVMGDNRDFSNDSRFWGFVPIKNVKGKALFIWLSLWVSFSDSQLVFRPERIGTILN